MANLIVVCGPQAVGKMTVAEALRDKLRWSMMMNHDSIELSDRIFGFGTPAQKALNSAIRENVFALAVQHNVNLIFTFVCAFDEPEDVQYLRDLEAQFAGSGGSFISSSFPRRSKRVLPATRPRTAWSASPRSGTRNGAGGIFCKRRNGTS